MAKNVSIEHNQTYRSQCNPLKTLFANHHGNQCKKTKANLTLSMWLQMYKKNINLKTKNKNLTQLVQQISVHG